MSLPDELRIGIELHRKIDSFTDSHQDVKELKSIFPRNIRRFSGIVIDVYFDHILCRHWHVFNDLEFANLMNRFYQELDIDAAFASERFDAVRGGLIKHKWLSNYYSVDTVLSALAQIEKRFKSKLSFAEESFAFVRTNQEEITKQFMAFYPKLILYCEKESEKLINEL